MFWNKNKMFWKKKNVLQPLKTDESRCRYDARAANATSWSEEAPRGFGHRGHFDATSNPALLFLDHIGQHEGGFYRCRVDFKTAQTRNSLINLTIIGNDFEWKKKKQKMTKDIVSLSMQIPLKIHKRKKERKKEWVYE
jgi:hypothetical protein